MDSVLDFAELQSKEAVAKRERVDVAQVAREVARFTDLRAKGQGLSLDVTLPPEPVYAALDPRALRRTLINLVENAIKFTQEGSVRVTVRPAGEVVELVVADTGIGMDTSFLPDLFEPFRQEPEGLARSHGGIGLGLSIVRRLVDVMDGEIEVETEKGQGTRFTMRLPCAFSNGSTSVLT